MSSTLGSDDDRSSSEEYRSSTCPSCFTESGRDGWRQQGHGLGVVVVVVVVVPVASFGRDRFSSSWDGNDDEAEEDAARADKISKAWWKSIPFMRVSLRLRWSLIAHKHNALGFCHGAIGVGKFV